MVSGSSPVSSSTNAYTRYTGYSINSVGCFSDSRYTTFSPSGSSTNRIITCTAARSGFFTQGQYQAGKTQQQADSRCQPHATVVPDIIPQQGGKYLFVRAGQAGQVIRHPGTAHLLQAVIAVNQLQMLIGQHNFQRNSVQYAAQQQRNHGCDPTAQILCPSEILCQAITQQADQEQPDGKLDVPLV